MDVVPPLPPHPPSSSLSKRLFCNGCLIELKLFESVSPAFGGRIPKRYYTNCQHVLCENCKMHYRDQCAACKKPCRTIEINNQMSAFYRTYFEPMVKLRANTFGAIQFQTIQREHITSQMIAQGRQLQVKYREVERKLMEVKKERADAMAERRKILMIFSKIREGRKRNEEMARQQPHLAEPLKNRRRSSYRESLDEEKKRQQPHLARPQKHRRRSSYRDSPDRFNNANQNQHHAHGYGHGLNLRQNNFGHVNHGWADGFDATTVAPTNFGETPQTYRPF